ncbi:uncharacterized protein LOC125499406 [Beta vulgaris subsp. vulgaris]|uniref:uncharacterized protein LOC125499406 n=1 Tax=Beta vulgaris subsp. vulgaris TaxID=3555 RepID=UPI002037552F|nr:uncharacterized protein LOC125499406 [Beta vulgaris subsp. vulgaris]
MSPKTATISLSLALLLLTITLSSATTDCPGFDSVSDILRHYDIPPGLFPDYVEHFRCDPINVDSHMLSIQLQGVCAVSRTMFGIGNRVVCQPQMSAIISYRQLTNVKGVTVTLTFGNQPIGELMTVTEVKVFQLGNFLQFDSDKGKSPWFPVALIQVPPKCDRTAGAIDAKNDNKAIPNWVHNYGRLLPLVA